MTLRHRGVGLAAFLTACNPDAGTALFLHATLEGASAAQLRLSGFDDETRVFGPEVFPPVPTRPLSSVETVRVLLPDSLGGRPLSLRAEGLAAGRVTLRGSARTEVVYGEEVNVSIALRP